MAIKQSAPSNSETVKFKDRALALLCTICPFCIVARKWPDSKFAKKLHEAEKNCPACRAYHRVKARKA